MFAGHIWFSGAIDRSVGTPFKLDFNSRYIISNTFQFDLYIVLCIWLWNRVHHYAVCTLCIDGRRIMKNVLRMFIWCQYINRTRAAQHIDSLIIRLEVRHLVWVKAVRKENTSGQLVTLWTMHSRTEATGLLISTGSELKQLEYWGLVKPLPPSHYVLPRSWWLDSEWHFYSKIGRIVLRLSILRRSLFCPPPPREIRQDFFF